MFLALRSSSHHLPETAVIRHLILPKKKTLGAKIVAIILGQQEDLASDVLIAATVIISCAQRFQKLQY